MKNLSLIFLGFVLGTLVSVAQAKHESGSLDAKSVVGYGRSGSVISTMLVDSGGAIQIQ